MALSRAGEREVPPYPSCSSIRSMASLIFSLVAVKDFGESCSEEPENSESGKKEI